MSFSDDFSSDFGGGGGGGRWVRHFGLSGFKFKLTPLDFVWMIYLSGEAKAQAEVQHFLQQVQAQGMMQVT